MNVSPVRGVGFSTSKKMDQTVNNQPNFQATLRVSKNLVNEISGETESRFKTIMNRLAYKLSNETLNPEDTVVVSHAIGNTTIPVKGGIKGNLSVSINNTFADFYYDAANSVSRLVEDLYNTYKHVRHLEHYKP